VAIALAATVGTSTIIVVASRAFAAYYAIQAVVALRTAERSAAKFGYGMLAIVMATIALLAEPVG
jgi:hypothetical protein